VPAGSSGGAKLTMTLARAVASLSSATTPSRMCHMCPRTCPAQTARPSAPAVTSSGSPRRSHSPPAGTTRRTETFLPLWQSTSSVSGSHQLAQGMMREGWHTHHGSHQVAWHIAPHMQTHHSVKAIEVAVKLCLSPSPDPHPFPPPLEALLPQLSFQSLVRPCSSMYFTRSCRDTQGSQEIAYPETPREQETDGISKTPNPVVSSKAWYAPAPACASPAAAGEHRHQREQGTHGMSRTPKPQL